LILGSVVAGLGITYFTIAPHLKGNLICFEDQYVKFGFPENWYGSSSVLVISTCGNIYAALFVEPPPAYLDIALTVYDKNYTNTFIKENNLTRDPSSVISFLANNTYNYLLQSSSSATLILNCSKTIQVSDHTAACSVYLIQNAYLDPTTNMTKNVLLMIVSYFDSDRLVQIIYWGNQDDFQNSLQMFETMILPQLTVKP
jgi:hypothetical protein